MDEVATPMINNKLKIKFSNKEQELIELKNPEKSACHRLIWKPIKHFIDFFALRKK